MYNCIPMAYEKIKIQILIQMLTHGYQDFLDPDVFQISFLSLFKIRNMLRQSYYLDDLLILTNSSFKDHLIKLDMFLSRLLTNEMMV
jgi:hypothetical protein